jgi:hypothetical protein
MLTAAKQMLVKLEQRLICGIHDRIARRRIGIEGPGIYWFIRIIRLGGLTGVIRALLRIIFCHMVLLRIVR